MTSLAQKRRRLNASIVNDNDENDGNLSMMMELSVTLSWNMMT